MLSGTSRLWSVRSIRDSRQTGPIPAVFFWVRRCARVAAEPRETLMNDTTLIDTHLPTVSSRVQPRGGLDVLSRAEVAQLRDASTGGMHDLLRQCALAVLTSGSMADDPRAARELYPDFDIEVQQLDRGLRLDLHNAPAMAFGDGEIILGVAELLFAAVGDLAVT